MERAILKAVIATEFVMSKDFSDFKEHSVYTVRQTDLLTTSAKL